MGKDEAKQVGGYVIGFARVIGTVSSKEQALVVMKALLMCMQTITDTWGAADAKGEKNETRTDRS